MGKVPSNIWYLDFTWENPNPSDLSNNALPVSEQDVGSEESHLHVRLSSLAVVLLHEDILTVSPETGRLTPSSLQQMDALASEFFQRLGLFAASGYGKKDFETAREIFIEACQLNHIRFVLRGYDLDIM